MHIKTHIYTQGKFTVSSQVVVSNCKAQRLIHFSLNPIHKLDDIVFFPVRCLARGKNLGGRITNLHFPSKHKGGGENLPLKTPKPKPFLE